MHMLKEEKERVEKQKKRMLQQTYKITTMSIQRCHNVAHDIYAMLCVFWDKKKLLDGILNKVFIYN